MADPRREGLEETRPCRTGREKGGQVCPPLGLSLLAIVREKRVQLKMTPIGKGGIFQKGRGEIPGERS